MAVPPFREDGWLPEGHHPATWQEIAEHFDGSRTGGKRAAVYARLIEWCNSLREKGLTGRLILDGSFISRKPEPGDFDLLFVYDETTAALLRNDADARFLVDYPRCKEAGYGDIFLMAEEMVLRFPQFCDLTLFDRDKHTQQPKGVIEVTL